MVKNNEVLFVKDFTLGGTGIILGSSLVGKLPNTPATAGVQKGFTTSAKFLPTIATVGALGSVGKRLSSLEKQLEPKNLKQKSLKGGKI